MKLSTNVTQDRFVLSMLFSIRLIQLNDFFFQCTPQHIQYCVKAILLGRFSWQLLLLLQRQLERCDFNEVVLYLTTQNFFFTPNAADAKTKIENYETVTDVLGTITEGIAEGFVGKT